MPRHAVSGAASLAVTVLGSGTAVPVPDRFPAGYLVQANGRSLLIDLGPGVLRRLAQTAVRLDQVEAVLLTHYHTDHCADLAALLFALRNPRYAGRPPLRVLGAPGLHALLAKLTAAWPWLAPKGYALEAREIEPGPLDLYGLEARAWHIRHTAASLGYRLAAAPGGAAAAFSGDADECPELAQLAAGAALFVCDSAFPDALRVEGHLTPSLAGAAAAAAGVGTLCLTHFYPECEGHDLLAEAARTFSGRTVLARDLMRFDL